MRSNETVQPTQNIRLVAHTPGHLRALLEGTEAYERRFLVKVADGVRDFLIGPEVSAEFLARLKGPAAADPWKDGFGVLHVADNVIIGFGSFTGAPDAEGMVEIAYGIAARYQGRGHASEAARALIAYALASGQVRTIQAHTLPEQNASTRVLVKCGFTFMGEIIHPEDGPVWRWERSSTGILPVGQTGILPVP
jgi:RimJ/RimL family protein N-acetyltransferase